MQYVVILHPPFLVYNKIPGMNISLAEIENHWHRRQTCQQSDSLFPIITLFISTWHAHPQPLDNSPIHHEHRPGERHH